LPELDSVVISQRPAWGESGWCKPGRMRTARRRRRAGCGLPRIAAHRRPSFPGAGNRPATRDSRRSALTPHLQLPWDPTTARARQACLAPFCSHSPQPMAWAIARARAVLMTGSVPASTRPARRPTFPTWAFRAAAHPCGHELWRPALRDSNLPSRRRLNRDDGLISLASRAAPRELPPSIW